MTGQTPQDPAIPTDELLMTPPATAAAPATPAAPRRRASAGEPYAVVGRPRNEGHGKRLTAAFEALEVFPALAESRNRLLALVSEERPSTGDVVRAIESDVALVIAVLRLANGLDSPRRGQVDSVVAAVEVALARGRAAASPPTPRPSSSSSAARPGTPRPSASACTPWPCSAPPTGSPRSAGYPHRDRLLVTALLHDVGKLVLMHAYPGYPHQVHGPARTPEERLHYERRELGVDHALVGGVLARRWNLPKAVASAIERHHADDAEGDAAFVRLADMLAHYSQGSPVSSNELLQGRPRRRLRPERAARRALRPAVPDAASARARSSRARSPARELEVLKRLAQGMVYKQIAHELSLSTSTVRTHLHNIYGKLGAVDRAQAVLHATERGWL